MACGSACVDTASSTSNCGACGKACSGAEQCIASACTTVAGFAVRKVYLGDTDRSGTASSVAWKTFGRNIDGLASVGSAPNTECKRVAGAAASSQDDGNDGIDTSWGKNLIPFFSAFLPNQTKSANDLLEAGARTPMFQFTEPPPASATSVSFGLVTAESTIAPQWDGRDSRPIAESSTTGGKPKVVFSAATITSGALVSGATTGTFVLSFAFGGQALDLPIRLPRVSMAIAADGKTATGGTLSGVISTADFVSAFGKVAGAISQDLCSGSTRDALEQSIRQASDILVDGTQDSSKDCDAISIGIGFDAVAVAVGAVAGPAAPAKDPCAP
jgi:hypothetical protein